MSAGPNVDLKISVSLKSPVRLCLRPKAIQQALTGALHQAVTGAPFNRIYIYKYIDVY